MTKFGILGATALSLSLAIAAPAFAQQVHSGRAGAHAPAGNMGHAAMGAGPRMGAAPRAQANFGGGAQANVTTRANFAGRGNVARSNAQFAEGDRGVLGGGQFRGRDRGYGRGAGFAVGAAAAGVATGAAIAAGDYGYGYGYGPSYYGDSYAYGPDYYGDSYAFDAGPVVAFDQPVPVEGPVVADASYCAQRYRSYDPASGTYLGYDGLRHPCP